MPRFDPLWFASPILVGLLALSGCGGQPSTDRQAADETPAETPGPKVVPGTDLAGDLARAQAFLATRPEYEQPLGVGLKPPEGVQSSSAASCGRCHTQIYAEWKVSTHALAWKDRQFQAEGGKSGNRWLCVNCHTPMLSQHDQWPVGLQQDDVDLPILVQNPALDEGLRDEGITCVGCHVVDGVIHGPGLSNSHPPHEVVADPRFTDNRVCLRCHQAVATYPGKQYACTFATGTEWAAGPYAAAGKGCADCHMPRAEMPVAEDGPVRSVPRHWWRGAGIPKVAGIQPPLKANPPGLGLAATWTDAGVHVVATNAHAGHDLPTGDPERWVQIDVRYEDAKGQPVGTPGSERIGQTWKWYPVAEKVGDNRLAPRASRDWTVPLPDGATRAVVEASSHRMTQETADYHHLDGYPRFLVTHHLVVTPQGTTGGVVAK